MVKSTDNSMWAFTGLLCIAIAMFSTVIGVAYLFSQ